MLLNDDVRSRLAERAEVSRTYQEFMIGIGGNDLKVYLSNRYQFLHQQILLEREQRTNKVSTDVIRGQLIQIQAIYDHINLKLSDEHTVTEQIVKLDNKESN